ncbi:hypothetical protein ABZS66_54475, partial [Dactylosporangium sp. NPDC005572]|uniref:hypothetical protein n=1 Tax=Dactylosporangium sp. NPDC005572 TaxID=3156889 RepID=UPI00339F8686
MSIARIRPGEVRSIGVAQPRLEARDKVTGHAPYAVDHPVPGAVYAWPVLSTVAAGWVSTVDTQPARALGGGRAV